MASRGRAGIHQENRCACSGLSLRSPKNWSVRLVWNCGAGGFHNYQQGCLIWIVLVLFIIVAMERSWLLNNHELSSLFAEVFSFSRETTMHSSQSAPQPLISHVIRFDRMKSFDWLHESGVEVSLVLSIQNCLHRGLSFLSFCYVLCPLFRIINSLRCSR